MAPGIFVLLTFLCFMLQDATSDGAGNNKEWHYPTHLVAQGEDSHSSWVSSYPYCGGHRQSPINIDSEANSIVYNTTLGSVSTAGYSGLQNGTLTNNGHVIQYNLPSGDGQATVTGGPLRGRTYTLVQAHFHFGSRDTAGSEHTIDGSQYPAELHFVHYNSDKYSSLARAVNESDGLAVIGVFFEIGDANLEIDRFDVSAVPYKGNVSNVATIDLSGLLPSEGDYYTYPGSLTTPPCFESVTWIVMKTPISMSSEQMTALRNAKTGQRGDVDIHSMADNYRSVQAINSRTVNTNFAIISSTTLLQPSLTAMCIAIAAALLTTTAY